jgi:ribosomal protein S18 acetylase RimI-like enzyme
MDSAKMRPVEMADLKQIADSMTRAFLDDPMMVYLMEDAEKRPKKLNWMLTKLTQYCLRYGVAYTDDNRTGGSVWLTPGNTTMTTIRIMRAGMWQMPFKLGWKGFSRFNKLDAAASKMHKKAVPGDHWYLLGLGTDPDQQGSGVGTAAIEVGAEQAQAAGLPVYLETMAEANVPFYEKRGFEVAEEFATDDGLRIWSMLRNPT